MEVEKIQLGPIQADIMRYLMEAETERVYIGSLTRTEYFRGYSLEQIEAAAQRLVKRGVIKEVGPRFYRIEK